MTEEEPEFTIAMRTSRTDGPLIEGSKRRECGECGHEVWVSPGTLKSVQAGIYPDTYRCVDCTTEDTDD